MIVLSREVLLAFRGLRPVISSTFCHAPVDPHTRNDSANISAVGRLRNTVLNQNFFNINVRMSHLGTFFKCGF